MRRHPDGAASSYTFPPHVQGTAAPLRLRHSAHGLTDGAGLPLVRRLWDRLQLGARIDRHASEIGGRFQSPLMIESWLTLLLVNARLKVPARDRLKLPAWVVSPRPGQVQNRV